MRSGVFRLIWPETIIINFWTVLDLHCCTGFSLVAASRGYTLVGVRGLLIVGVSLVSECGL